jgi:hypothetical protein
MSDKWKQWDTDNPEYNGNTPQPSGKWGKKPKYKKKNLKWTRTPREGKDY